MPVYKFKSPQGDVFEIEAPEGTSEGQAFEAFQRAMKTGKTPKIETPQSTAKQRSDMALEGSGWGERAMINLGAGVTNLWEGAKDLVGQGDEGAIKDKRELDNELADSTGGGKLIQLLGEILPTLAIPAGGFVRGAQGAANAGRMAFGGAPAAVSAAGRSGTAAATGDAALAGATFGALQPTVDDESRAANTTIGAVGGAVLPAGIAGTKYIASLFTRGGAERRAAEEMIQRMGGVQEAEDAIASIISRGFGPSATRNIPMTAAELTQNPALAKMELGAQGRFTEDWVPLREQQVAERYNSFLDATKGADELATRKAARDKVADPYRDRALARSRGDMWFHTPVSEHITKLERGGSGSDPAIQSLARYVRGELENGITPERLYTVRKVLANKLSGPAKPGDDLAAAVQGRQRETLGIMKSIDEALNQSSGGRWDKYLEKYINRSGPVDDAKAATQLREVFTGEGRARVKGVPDFTGRELGQAVDKYGTNAFGDRFSDTTKAKLLELRENLRMTEDLQRVVKKTGTGGGGSQTQMTANEVLGKTAREKVTTVVPGIRHLYDQADLMTKAAISDALRDPDRFVRVIKRKLAQNDPLTRSEQAILVMIRSSGPAAIEGSAALTQQ